MEDERQEKKLASSLSPLPLFHICLSVVLSFLHSINIYSAPAIFLATEIAVVNKTNMILVLIGILKNEWRGGERHGNGHPSTKSQGLKGQRVSGMVSCNLAWLE